MQLFQVPPPTRFDLNFTIAGFPVRVHPLFWLIAVFIGVSDQGIPRLIIWVAIVFVSILIHELGHALAMAAEGISSRIVLHFAGGLTVPESVSWGSGRAGIFLNPEQQIRISFAGPLMGFLFAGLLLVLVAVSGGTVMLARILGVIPIPTAFFPAAGGLVNYTITTILWINVFWGLFNLLPVYPLDGGSITRSIMLKLDPWEGVKKSLWISTVAGGFIALTGLVLLNNLFLSLFFGLLALQSYQALRGRPGGF